MKNNLYPRIGSKWRYIDEINRYLDYVQIIRHEMDCGHRYVVGQSPNGEIVNMWHDSFFDRYERYYEE